MTNFRMTNQVLHPSCFVKNAFVIRHFSHDSNRNLQQTMNTTGFDLASTIADVSQIERNGQLSELLSQLSIDCRGLPADRARLFTANELIREATVAKALKAMFDLPLDECQAAVRSVLRGNRAASGHSI
jgi:hypothetical protein